MNKIVLITGGSRGLGKSMALHLADKGWDVVVTYHSQQQAADLVVDAIRAKGQNAVALQLDISDTANYPNFVRNLEASLQAIWQRSCVDALVNNAGSGVFLPFAETGETEFMRMVNEHIKAPYFLTQALLPRIQDGGQILNVSSGLTRFASPGFSAYAAMKSAVETLSVYLAKELGGRGIRVNVIAPGAIETDFGGGYVRDTPAVNRHLAELTALGRVGQADDIGGAVAALMDDGAAWMNAQRIEVSGGQAL